MRRASPKSVVWMTSSLLKAFKMPQKNGPGDYAMRLGTGLCWVDYKKSDTVRFKVPLQRFLRSLKVFSRKNLPSAAIGSEVNLMPPGMVCVDSNHRCIGPDGNRILNIAVNAGCFHFTS